MTLCIGILNADEVRPGLEEVYGEYPNMFSRLLKAIDSSIKIVTYHVFNGEYPDHIDDVDAYILTGCRYSVYEDKAWIQQLGKFIVDLNVHKKKLVGICFGHQMVAHFLGGKTANSANGWKFGAQACTIREPIPGVADSGDIWRFLSAHQDQIVQLAPGTKVLASSDSCPYVITRLGTHILTIQWHPEFTQDYMHDLLVIRRDVIGETIYQVAKDSLNQPIDNVKFNRWMFDFIRCQ